MKIFRVRDILDKFDDCIINKKPFSLIRWGDGGLKFLSAVLRGDVKSLNKISRKEGIPNKFIISVVELWGYYARHADFIDCPQVYFSGNFWPRVKSDIKKISDSTCKKLINWKEIYNRFEFDNDNYCNPEFNYLMVTNFYFKNRTIFEIMKDRKICIITPLSAIKRILNDYGYNVDIIQIVRQYENHYERSFEQTLCQIREKANKYDFWFVSGGELGRIYTGMIKEYGGRAIDLGFISQFWMGDDLHPRLQPYMRRNKSNLLGTKLTDEGKKYARYL